MSSDSSVPNPDVRQGDPFFAEGQRPNLEDESPCFCWDGWHYLGFAGEDLDGNFVEEVERVACKRCQQAR